MSDPAPTAAKKKRGPNTPEGKARSSMNALKHGLRARRFFLLPEEDPAEFSSFVADIRSAYTPEDAVELGQVEAIAVAMWREIRADRIEGETMALNKPANKEQSHGTDLYRRQECVALTTALRYRTQAQMETRRATDLFWRHRKARLAGLLDEPAEERETTAGHEASAPCTNEYPVEPVPVAAGSASPASSTNEFPTEPASVAASPAPPGSRMDELPAEPGTLAAAAAPAAFCTNEFRAPVPPPPEDAGADAGTLLSTYRALREESVAAA
jgi:hypothetical protein